MTETIGTCEICGATDHHLVEGLCPVCRPKTTTVVISGRQCGKTFADDAWWNNQTPPKNFDCKIDLVAMAHEAFGASADLTRAFNGDDT
jgi:hypothetical protein